MRWTKLGHVYVADGERDWQASHAYCPTPIGLGDGRIRVYCAFWDTARIGRVGWVDIDEDDPTRVLAVSDEPVLDRGEPGAFDDNGVTPLSAVRLDDGTIRLYYAGWQLGVRVRYFLFTGLAESRDNGKTFARVSRAPVLDRSDEELQLRSSVHVRRDGDGWRIWYASTSDWVVNPDGISRPRYALRQARSQDGVTWPPAGGHCIELEDEDEIGFARPSVVEHDGVYKMWYALRRFSVGYRLGYAESSDGLVWKRNDAEAGLDVGSEGWDSEMVGLSAIHERDGSPYLFYNGNNYGETGFGVAVADSW
jgi:predicted GH43/DUF377 family glycosyl hydrolase